MDPPISEKEEDKPAETKGGNSDKKKDLMGAGRIYWEKLNGELYLSAMPKGPPPTNWIKYEQAKKTEAISFIKGQLSKNVEENAVTDSLGSGASVVTGAIDKGVSAIGTGATVVTDALTTTTGAVTGAIGSGVSIVGNTLNAFNPFASSDGPSMDSINAKLGVGTTLSKEQIEKLTKDEVNNLSESEIKGIVNSFGNEPLDEPRIKFILKISSDKRKTFAPEFKNLIMKYLQDFMEKKQKGGKKITPKRKKINKKTRKYKTI